MPSDMEHERYRWARMGTTKLLTRLRRITRPDKLQNFATLALESGEQRLIDECYGRSGDLGYTAIQSFIERHEDREPRPTMENWSQPGDVEEAMATDAGARTVTEVILRNESEARQSFTGTGRGRGRTSEPPLQQLPPVRKIKRSKKKVIEPGTRIIRFGKKKKEK